MTIYYGEKIDPVIYGANGIDTTAEFVALAMAALDQAGLSEVTQQKIEELIWDELPEEARL